MELHRHEHACAVAPHPIHFRSSDFVQSSEPDELDLAPLQIRVVVGADDYHRAAGLLARRYESRGYAFRMPDLRPLTSGATLLAFAGSQAVGTLSVGLDGKDGLLCEEAFADEVGALRHAGLRLCEFTKLAVSEGARSRQVLTLLFHAAFVHAHRLGNADRLLIEVNPRHVGAYKRMLGFDVLSEERPNPRVGAPGVLLGLELALAAAKVQQNQAEQRDDSARSFYRFSLPRRTEAAVTATLLAA